MRKGIENFFEYENAVKELMSHDRLYYEKFEPAISDYEYDLLVKMVEKYEAEHPEDVLSYSPTQRVGETLTKGFRQKKHVVPMLSLANTYSKEEIEEFINRVYKLLERKDLDFCIELKMDGTAVSVRYENGVLVQALTRGNGKIGDLITGNIKTIKTLPLKLIGDDIPEVLEIRGEVFMHKPNFQRINEKREEAGLEPMANPRNAAAGSLKLLDPKEVAKRHLDIVLYGIAEGPEINSQYEVHKYLKKFYLPVSSENHFQKCKNLEEILRFADKIQKIRDDLTFEIDGIVIKLDDLSLQKKLGFTGKSPRYAVAYKFAPEQAFTKIRDITVQVGRTGVLTPVAELKPVKLAGSTISRATLHNQDEIERKDIRIGDWVVIEKGGDVIPKVVHVDVNKRVSHCTAYKMPDCCPVCHEKVIRKDGEVAYRCQNPNCPGKKLRKIAFFAGKQGMDIDFLGIKIVEKLLEKKTISKPSDIYLLDEEKLSKLEGFKEKSIKNLLKSIEKSKKCSLSRFIMSLEIPYVGAETADLLAKRFGDIEKVVNASKEDLIAIEGIGDKVAESIVGFFKTPELLEEVYRLLSYGVRPEEVNLKFDTSHPFYQKTFVLTGSLDHYTRNEAAQLIKEKGGKISSSVSKNTDFLLAGSDPGSKYDKALKLNIKILTEKEFQNFLS